VCVGILVLVFCFGCCWFRWREEKIIIIQRLLVVAKNKTVRAITLWNMALEFNSTRILRNFLVIGRLRSSHILPFETEIRVPAKAAGQVTVFFFSGSFRINLICYL